MDRNALTADNERERFALTLSEALRDAGFPVIGYTELTREFNHRSGQRPMTVHAVRKWMVGDAIPTQERLAALASWLRVSPEWLRYGELNADIVSDPFDAQDDVALAILVADVVRLPLYEKKIVSGFVQILLQSQNSSKKNSA